MGENILKYISDKGLISKLYKELILLYSTQTNRPPKQSNYRMGGRSE